MLTTVEAEIDVDGSVRLLEPLKLSQKSRAIVTVLDKSNGNKSSKGDIQSALEFLQKNRLPKDSRPNAEEIEAQIMEARESWD